MSRKSRKQAGSQTANRQKARWRYLLRNPDFQTDIDHLCELFKKEALVERINRREEVADKWGLVRIPGEIIIYWPGVPLEPEDYPALEQYWSQFEVSVDYSPVASTELRDDRFLFFRVDLNHPTADLLPLIAQELRQVVNTRTRSRTRTDKIDFHLQVFDMASTGKTFSEIAHALRRRSSTVKSAYQFAGRRIFGPGADIPSKDALILAAFDLATHNQNCDVCKSVEDPKDFCETAQLYMNQDQVPQHDLTDLETQRHRDPDT